MLDAMSTNRPVDRKSLILKATWDLLEKNPGQEISMSDIAKASNISRQALYLHFPSRSELMIATSHFVDEEKGLDERLAQFYAATNGIELIEACVKIWGNYIPEIYGLARAFSLRKDMDQDMAAAWEDSTNCLREACHLAIKKLNDEGKLAPIWTLEKATDLFLTMLSVNNWADLTKAHNWTTQEYVDYLQKILVKIFVK